MATCAVHTAFTYVPELTLDPAAGLDSPRTPPASARIRLGAMAVGMGACLAIAVGLPYGEFVIQGTRLG